MKPLNEIYPPRFFGKRHKLHWRAPIVRDAIRAVLPLKSIIDVGCATGDIVQAFIEDGVFAMGMEGTEAHLKFSIIPHSSTYIHDLRTPLDFKFEFDLCLCLEVAEHIEPEYADIFVSNLCTLSNQILLSAAPPGQGGHYHVNCQLPKYWDEKFDKLGYYRVQSTAEMIKIGLQDWRHKPGIKAYYQNLLFFKKSN